MITSTFELNKNSFIEMGFHNKDGWLEDILIYSVGFTTI